MMTWYAVSANQFPNGAQDLEHALVENQAWAIIASMLFSFFFFWYSFVYPNGSPTIPVNANSTEKLNAAVLTADGSYTPTGTITTYAAEARNENA